MGQCGSSTGGQNRKEYAATNEAPTQSRQLLFDAAIHQSSVLGIASFDEKIVSCGDDNTIAVCGVDKLFSSDTTVPHLVLRGHEKAVNRVIYHNQRIISASRDLSLRMWSGEAFDTCTAIPNAHGLNISAISAVSSKEGVFYSGSRDYSVKVWDISSSSSAICEYSCPRNIVTSLCTSEKDPHMVYQGAEDLNVRVWDTRLSSANVPATVLSGYVYFPLCMSIQQDGHLLATGTKGFNSVGCGIIIWDLRQTRQPLVEHKGHAQDVTGISFCSRRFSEQMILSCSKDGTIMAWDVNNGLLDVCQYSNNKIFSCLTRVDTPNVNSERFVAGAMDGALEIVYLSKNGAGNFSIKPMVGTKPALLD